MTGFGKKLFCRIMITFQKMKLPECNRRDPFYLFGVLENPSSPLISPGFCKFFADNNHNFA